MPQVRLRYPGHGGRYLVIASKFLHRFGCNFCGFGSTWLFLSCICWGCPEVQGSLRAAESTEGKRTDPNLVRSVHSWTLCFVLHTRTPPIDLLAYQNTQRLFKSRQAHHYCHLLFALPQVFVLVECLSGSVALGGSPSIRNSYQPPRKSHH